MGWLRDLDSNLQPRKNNHPMTYPQGEWIEDSKGPIFHPRGEALCEFGHFEAIMDELREEQNTEEYKEDFKRWQAEQKKKELEIAEINPRGNDIIK